MFDCLEARLQRIKLVKKISVGSSAWVKRLTGYPAKVDIPLAAMAQATALYSRIGDEPHAETANFRDTTHDGVYGLPHMRRLLG